MSTQYVPGRGPLDACICVLGEAPGRTEIEQGRPFVGASGRLQEGYMRRVGIDPTQVRYENVYPMLPPGRGGIITSVPKEELARWKEDCLARLDALTHAQIIVPVGNTALACVTGLQQISLRRGSLYEWRNIYGRQVKVIPTIHPAAILRDTTLEYRTVKDWERIAREVERGSEVVYPQRQFILDPPRELLEAWEWNEEYLCIDIETNPKAKKILCVGFSCDSRIGISLSWTAKNKEIIRELCGNETPKLLQNGLYDLYWLRMFGVEVRNYQYDCLAMHHLLHPTEKHSLAFMTSIYTDEPYYKGGEDEDEEKVWEKEKIDWYALQEYNARDCMVEYEVGVERLWPLLKERGLEDHYFERYAHLFEPLLDMMTHGIAVDTEMMQKAYDEYTSEAMEQVEKAQQICGDLLFTFKTKGERALYYQRKFGVDDEEAQRAIGRLRKDHDEIIKDIDERGISSKILADILYKKWKLPPVRNRKTGKITTDEHTLRQLLQKVEKRGETEQALFLRCVLRYRHIKKLSEFYSPSRLDEDGRMRCEYTYATRPSRLSSRKNPMGGGANLQNQSRKVRGMFRADSGCVLVEVDLSQIQARFVYVMAYVASGDTKLLDLAQSKPWVTNIHRLNAVEMFHVPYDQVNEQQYYKAKITEHASNFGLEALHLQEVFLKGEEGIHVSIQECIDLIQRKFTAKPGIRDWQRSIREEYLHTKKLKNAWGDEIDLSYERPGEDLWRKCYAWKPQIDEARHMNLLGLIPTWRYIKEKKYKSHINMQVHDALVFSLFPEEAYDITKFCVESLEQEREYYGVKLVIPCSVKMGKTWVGGKEWKKMPGKEEFEKGIKEVMYG